MMRRLLIMLSLLPVVAHAGEIAPREGWRVMPTTYTHPELVERLLAAVPEEGMGVVTQAGPT